MNKRELDDLILGGESKEKGSGGEPANGKRIPICAMTKTSQGSHLLIGLGASLGFDNWNPRSKKDMF